MLCPEAEGARGLSPGFQPLGSLSLKRRALKLKGRKEGLAWRSRNNVMLVATSKSAALSGRFGFIGRVPRVETLG
jgi:hypothetical protein